MSIDSRTNINEFVYPGDGVTFDIVAYNNGPISAHDTVLVHRFYSPEHVLISEMRGPVGEIEVNGKRNIHFVFSTATYVPAGSYYTESYLYGYSDQGIEAKSAVDTDPILISARFASSIGATKVFAAETSSSPEVLGSQTQVLETNECESCHPLGWYMMVAILSLAYFLYKARKMEWHHTLARSFILPLGSYAGLLLTQTECTKGILFIQSTSIFCQLFLPLTYGIILAQYKLVKRCCAKQKNLA